MAPSSSHTAQASRCRSFPPIAARDARVLILGSMPSVASLTRHQYYGHPRNAFWRIMGRLFGAAGELPYRHRQAILRQHGVAVWDVLQECRRTGSLDAAIETASEVPNDLAAFLDRHRQVRTIFFNGQKAEAAFRRHARPRVELLQRPLCYIRLPSTSPAHAGQSFEQKLAAWQQVRRSSRAAGS